MKKTYIQPNTSIYNVETVNSLLTLSGGDTLSAGTGGTSGGGITDADVREDAAWDIWGDDQY